MNTLLKIKLVAYFCFLYAGLQLLSAIALMSEGDKADLYRALINSAIWTYLGYGLINKKDKWAYWLPAVFLSLIVLRSIIGYALLGIAGDLELIKALSAELITGLIVLILASSCLILMFHKDIRETFLKT